VGFFGQYIFDGMTWRSIDSGSAQAPELAAPWLSVEVLQAPELDDDSDFYDEDDLDDDEVFVELKTVTFLRAVGLSVPDELPSGRTSLGT
jgi:hypothetical protein